MSNPDIESSNIINLLEQAENGNNHAMNNLAICYYNGEGTEKNLERAFYWYQKAAENGYINAMYNLATCYYNGEGTEKNLERAFYWWQKAAENGDEVAMKNKNVNYSGSHDKIYNASHDYKSLSV